jgi:hypothetical protein
MQSADAVVSVVAKAEAAQEKANEAAEDAGLEPPDLEGRGLRRFLLRGLEKVDGEWHLIAATHNLLKLFRFRRSQQQAQWAATG